MSAYDKIKAAEAAEAKAAKVDKIAKIMEELRHHGIDHGTRQNVSDCAIQIIYGK